MGAFRGRWATVRAIYSQVIQDMPRQLWAKIAPSVMPMVQPLANPKSLVVSAVSLAIGTAKRSWPLFVFYFLDIFDTYERVIRPYILQDHGPERVDMPDAWVPYLLLAIIAWGILGTYHDVRSKAVARPASQPEPWVLEKLACLRNDGVELWNRGRERLNNDDTRPWLVECNSWRDEVHSVLKPVSPGQANIFYTLHGVPHRWFRYPVHVGGKRQQQLRNLDERLRLLGDILGTYR